MQYAAFNIEPGTILAGKYRIERVLGQGGMGIVAAAHHLHLEQRVALKLMLPHAMSSPEAISRFLREARAAARITSEHVARVFDVGTLENGAPYIAMEYLEGADLSQLMHARGRIAVSDVIEYLLQACEALAEAHKAGIVHRDLKPANLFLAQRVDGQQVVKVLDFGISKMSGGSAQSDAPATRTSALMGSPLYMSPEQMGSSRAVDARSDIWALGVVLHEMLSGLPPFDGDTLPQVCARVMSEPPPPLSERAPGLPPLLYEVVDRCLQKQPAARFQTIAELAFALEPMATARGRQSIERIARVQGVTPGGVIALGHLPVEATTAAPPRPSGTQATWGDAASKPTTRSKLPLVSGAAAAFAILGVSAWFLLRGPSLGAATEGAASAHAASEAVTRTSAAAPPTLAPIPPAPALTSAAPIEPSAGATEPQLLVPSSASTRPPVVPHALPAARPKAKPGPEVGSKPAAPTPASPTAATVAIPNSNPSPAPTSRSRL